MTNLILLNSSLWMDSTQAIARDFCKDIANNLKEVVVSIAYKSMRQCSLQVLGDASETFERSCGSPIKIRGKSNPYLFFVTRGDNGHGTFYVLHPRKVTRKVKDRDC
jgi:hypothetical protein